MRVVGVDPSLTGTGLAVITTTSPGQGVVGHTWTLRTRARGHDRLAFVRAQVMQAARGADLVVIEGLAYRAHDTDRASAGLWWLLTHAMWGAGLPYAAVAPSVRAKYATGRGNAGKDEVLLAVSRRYPGIEVTGNDDADALVLAALGARWLGHPLEVTLPAAHLGAVASVAWPELVNA